MRRLQMDMSGMDMTSSTSMEVTSSSTSSSTMDMSMSMDMSSTTTATSDEDYTCPVCGMSTKDMGYDNLNHISFAHGQTVYTCDSTAYAECEDSCDECEDGINDPVTGDDVTTSNYQYVCLNNGQKIYFASVASKNEYLNNVNSEPRYLVDSIICENTTCSDAENITVLSAAAQAFVPDLSSSSRSGSATASGSSAAVSVNSPTSLVFAVASVLAALAVMA
ncbi:hypothetical protein PHPALM_29130 [Phytophthora palmivora]|uniref:Uncharacterized protein n=1 Tax=Phytophthora palmivora TaxID=4796 RepID=A0A2P4X8C8_9STRA|nr:hypothetical protein PHPALM_29130 [Phytophthora palmivora]